MSDNTSNPSPGLAVFRKIHYGESDTMFAGSTAFRCENIAEAAIDASGLREKVFKLESTLRTILNDPSYEGGVQYWIRKHDIMASIAARTANNPSDVFVEIYASLLGGIAASELWSENVKAGDSAAMWRKDFVDAAYEMAEAAVRRLEKGAT